MPVFEYKALKSDGGSTNGRIDAGGRKDAMRMIEDLGLTPLKLVEMGEGNGSKPASKQAPSSPAAATPLKGAAGLKLNFNSNKVTFAALEDFTRSLSSLLTAGVPLSRALTILYKECPQPAAAAKWKEVHDFVIDGMPLAKAMERAPDVFPKVYVAMVEAGEAGGFLDVVLSQIADFQAREKELRAKVMSAMMYPLVLLTLATGVVIFLMVFFIPRFQALFAGFNAALPLITQVIVGASNAIRHQGLWVAGGLVLIIWWARRWIANERNRRAVEKVLLRAPVVGPLAGYLAMARFCRMLGTLLGAGVPLIGGLDVARRSLGYQTLIDYVAEAIDRVKKGETLAASLSNCRGIFPGSSLEMLSVAQESGRLEQELLRLAVVTEATLDRQLKTAVALMEPLMLFLMAGIIGTIFIGMILPIFELQDHIK
ncbi:MAG TPA: type II secretion system F family protein [Chthoniobacteraceae bacterium]|nr:type II secretion system F family protein [Chthoniobacteraceae bacterium]